MLDLTHSLIIETGGSDPDFLCFYAPTLPGFTGAGTSVADCLEQAGPAMREWRDYLAEVGSPVPPPDEDPVVLICNEPGPEHAPTIDRSGDEELTRRLEAIARSVRDDPDPEETPDDPPDDPADARPAAAPPAFAAA